MRFLKLFLIIFYVLFFYVSQAQPTLDDGKAHRHYWYYRTRFINDFTKIGGEQGDCICFPERSYLEDDISAAKVGPDQIDITNQYLSALALEYKLLNRNYQNTDETLKEIFYILKTYNRLDLYADGFWNNNPPANDHLPLSYSSINSNGFMLREDMPHDYFDTSDPNTPLSYQPTSKANYLHFNYAKNEYNSTATSANLSYTGLHEISKLTNDNKFSNYIGFGNGNQSQADLSLPMDKYFTMYIAFLMLKKYLPPTAIYYENGQPQHFQDGETNIQQEIRNMAARCYLYITDDWLFQNDWILRYPNGQHIAAGKDIWVYSFPMSKMYCAIQSPLPFIVPCNNYQDGVSAGYGLITYNALYLNPIPSIFPSLSSEDAADFLANCMAGSNAPVFPFIPAAFAMSNVTAINLMPWADLLRKVLHQSGNLHKSLNNYSNPISTAPCTGPFNYGGGNNAGFYWRSQDALEHPKSFLLDNPPPANYPGVDYMLLHNLYYEYLNQLDDAGNIQNGKYKNAVNLMDNYDNVSWPWKPFPSSPTVYGTQTNPVKVAVFQNLTSTAHVYASVSPSAPNNTTQSNIIYRAGKEITLLPGFQSDSGSEFYAFIKRYVCSDNDYGSGMRQSNNNMASNDYENDDMNTLPLHYVDYPESAQASLSTEEEEPGEYTSAEQQQAALQQQIINKNLAGKGIYNPDKNSDQRFLVLPNPNNGIFKVYATKIINDEIFSLSIIDMKGQAIKEINNLNSNIEEQVDLTQLAKGIYLVKLTSNKGLNSIKKISVN